ncbi:EF-P 5-aminopentanol modification-associated protein YfmF [Lentilactobacillus curieae]|uniref:EF-P 5-aminopentanol modification-associated protein YfmF n=1 Tax=Lentilactobacillus curieae TaxID=1138822 RepID=UPI00068E47FC|nr:insulinase family protein [Lentilactobacillus curieae]
MNEIKSKNYRIFTHNTDKFKTTKITIYFTLKSDEKNFAKMALLSELLGNATSKYSSETEVSRQLSRMYGASFGVTVLRYGDVHTLRINISFPNDKYLPDNHHVVSEIMGFLDEVINHPLIGGNQFEESFFNLHKANLLNYFNSIIENREYYATIQLQKLMFPNDINHGSFLYGTIDQLQKTTAADLFDFYQWLLKNANIMGFIGGHIDDEFVNQLDEIIPNTDHQFVKLDPFVKLPQIDKVARKEQKLEIDQTVLTMGYELPILSNDPDYYNAIVLNQVLGGSPQSVLFNDVREDQSLAYDISSSYNSLNGTLSVSAGILPQNQPLVEDLVAKSIEKIMNGNIDDTVISGIKQSLIDQRKSSADSLGAQIEKLFVKEITNASVDDDDFIAGVKSVKKSDVVDLAKQIKLRAVFALKGNGGSDENN